MRIIVLNCFSRNSLAVIRSVDRDYELIGGATRRRGFLDPDRVFRSRRLQEVFRHSDPTAEPQEFQDDIVNACQRYRVDAVLATGTTMTNALSQHKNEISARSDAIVLVEDWSKLALLSDKWRSYGVCQAAGIPMPRTALLPEPGKMEEALGGFRYPVVVKPRTSYAARGVAFFRTPQDLRGFASASVEASARDADGESAYVVQEAIEGELHDVTVCAKQGEVASMLTQRRWVSLYDFGGGGIINETTHDAELTRHAETIIRHVGWNGVMLFDFIKDADGQPFLLECNPKFWGTTQLTIDAGLNVAQQVIDLFALGKPLERQCEYEVGLAYRWLFPECVYHWFTSPRTPGRILKRIRNTFKPYGKRSVHNLHRDSLPHLIGIVLNGSEL